MRSDNWAEKEGVIGLVSGKLAMELRKKVHLRGIPGRFSRAARPAAFLPRMRPVARYCRPRARRRSLFPLRERKESPQLPRVVRSGTWMMNWEPTHFGDFEGHGDFEGRRLLRAASRSLRDILGHRYPNSFGQCHSTAYGIYLDIAIPTASINAIPQLTGYP